MAKNARAVRPTKTNKCLLRMLESVIKVVQRTHWHVKILRSVFQTVKIIPNRSMAVFTLKTDYLSETDNPSSISVKIDGKQMNKVRRIVHPKLRPFHFQIKTYYLSDANYPTDNRSLE